MGKKSYFYHIEYEDSEEKRIQQKKQVISGFTCMENDRLFELTDGPELQTGDRIVYEKVGAYTLCLAPLSSAIIRLYIWKKEEKFPVFVISGG